MEKLNLLDPKDRVLARTLAALGQGCYNSEGTWVPSEDLKELVSIWDEFLTNPTRTIRVEGGVVTDVEKR